MKVMIFTPFWQGHHLDHAALLSHALSPLVDDVVLLTSRDAVTSPEYQIQLSERPTNLTVDASVGDLQPTGRFPRMNRARRAWDALTSGVERHKPDRLMIPTADFLLPGSAMFARRLALPASRVDALFLVGTFAYAGLPWRYRMRGRMELFSIKHSPFGRIFFLDPLVHEWVRARQPALARRCFLSPDPVSPVPRPDQASSRLRFGIPSSARVIGCVGVLDARKGVDEFVRSFGQCRVRDDYRVFLAGKTDASVMRAYEGLSPEHRSRVVHINRLLSSDEFAAAVSASDVVAMPYHYPNHLGSASVLIRAVAGQRPVLAAEKGWTGHVTRKFGLGFIYPSEPALRPAAIERAFNEYRSFRLDGAAEGFVQFHSRRAYCDLWTAPVVDEATQRDGGSQGPADAAGQRGVFAP
jgi:glycosyltransferase involved in cell wall biosynthesis